MKSSKKQLLVTLLSVLTSASILALRGLPPSVALVEAARAGDLDQTRRSLDWGCPPNGEWGAPLYTAAQNGHNEVAKLLIARGADVNAKFHQTPLHVAALVAPAETVSLLIAAGADVDSREYGILGRTPLHLVAMLGRVDIATLLLDSGADIAAQDDKGWTPLHWALFQNGLNPVVVLLIHRGAAIDAKDNEGRTLLHRAADGDGFITTAEVLVANGADVNAKDNQGMTPLGLALKTHASAVAEVLRQHGAK